MITHQTKSMKKLMSLFIVLALPYMLMAQTGNVGIGTSTPHASAILDASSTTKGLLTPRMTKVQKNTIPAPAKGLLIFQDDVDSTGFYYYDGAAWLWLEVLGKAGWKTTGNAGTDTSINFIGTTDNMPLRFKQNGQHMGQWDLGKSNYYIGRDAGINNILASTFSIGIGDSALANNLSASSNTAIGHKALKKNQFGSNNLAIGSFALENLEGTGFGGNTAMGVSALRFAKNTQFNTAIGTSALQEHRDSTSNTAIGFQAMVLDTTGSRNVAVGSNALARNANGSRNIAIGFVSGFNNSSGSRNTFVGNAVNASQTAVFNYDPAYTGRNNSAIGASSFFNNISGNYNNILGDSALFSNTTGSNNIAIGSQSLNTNTIGNDNTIIGYQADAGFNNLVNATAIGAKSQIDTSNAMVLGSINGINSATANVNVAIGTTKPMAALHISRGNSGSILNIPSNRTLLIEDNTSSYIQLLHPSTSESGILAGNESTTIKSGIFFQADSSIALKTGGINTRMLIDKIGNTEINGNLKINNGGATTGEVLTATDNFGNSIWQSINQNPAIGFSATISADVSIANNSFISLVFNTETVDDGGNNFNPATGIYTAPSAGMYQFEVSVYWNGLTAIENLYLTINGVRRKFTSTPVATGIQHTQQLSAFLKLNAGDQVGAQVQQNSGAVIIIDNAAAGTYFSGVKIY